MTIKVTVFGIDFWVSIDSFDNSILEVFVGESCIDMWDHLNDTTKESIEERVAASLNSIVSREEALQEDRADALYEIQREMREEEEYHD